MSDRFQEDYERARAAAPYHDDRLVDRLTRQLVDAGHPILQSHRFGTTDYEHVAHLVGAFAPPIGAQVLDIGCGVGAVAIEMLRLRPDLGFTLLNISPAQLAIAPSSMHRVAGHMHHLPFASSVFGAAMFCFSLGHGRVDLSLLEAARVVRPGGVVFAYELTSDQPEQLVDLMGYRPHRIGEVIDAGRLAELELSQATTPVASSAQALELFGEEAFTRHGFDRCRPVVYRAVRSHCTHAQPG